MTPVPAFGPFPAPLSPTSAAVSPARRRRQRLIQELAVRGAAALAVLSFGEVLLLVTGVPGNRFIRATALAALLINVPYYYAAVTDRWPRAQAYVRMLIDVLLLTVGLYAAGGLAAAPFVSIYTPIMLYAAFTLSSAACIVATTAATAAFLGMALLQHEGWIPARAALAIPDWWITAFNVLLLDVVGVLTTRLAEAYRRSRHEAISATRELEHAHGRIVEAERLRAIGELSAGVAHHLNNLLAVALGRIQIALRRADEGPEVARNLEIAERGLLDAGEVVRRMSVFSRAQAMAEWAPVDLNELAREVLEITRPRWQSEAQIHGVAIDARLEAGRIPQAAGDPAALREVLMNLVFNAVDALPRGGSIVVRTWAEGDAVFCAVSDTGVGMTPAVRKRAFEPFFTTRGLKATGLGLSVSYGIVRRHGGELDIDSAEGRGTTVTFRVLATGPAPAPERTPAAPPSTRLRILLIDDDVQVRAVVAEMLGLDGHTVVSAAGGLEGLARLDGDEPVDLVLTDLGMPGMTGWDVARAVKARRPSIRVGLITGWGEEQRARFEEEGVADFVVQKPVTRAALVQAIGAARV